MTLREGIERVLAEYLGAKTQSFTQHPIACLIRQDIRNAVAKLSGDEERLIFKGSAGQSDWVEGPWVGLYNPLITDTAQCGYYICYLFREDMQGVYLSLNQGAEEVKQQYKSGANAALLARAQNYSGMLGLKNGGVSGIKIDLAPASKRYRTAS